MSVEAEHVAVVELLHELDTLSNRLDEAVERENRIGNAHPDNLVSAENLVRYVALRQHDIRHLQAELATRGLSSLGRAEPHVRATLDAVRRAVAGLCGNVLAEIDLDAFTEGSRLIERNSTRLLGKPVHGRATRIMVTLPSEAAQDGTIVDRIVAAGAEVVRINCAHDGPTEWAAMIEYVRVAQRAQGRHVTVTMDIAGPKLRTGPIAVAPSVLHVKPLRDEFGRPVQAARVWLTRTGGPVDAAIPSIQLVDESWLSRRATGDEVQFRDARHAHRTLIIVSTTEDGCYAEMSDTSYIVPGTELEHRRNHYRDRTTVAVLPPRHQKLRLHVGDELDVQAAGDPVDPSCAPARIGCTLPRVFADALVGHRIYFDDGMIGGVIEDSSEEQLRVKITEALPHGSRLGAAKGINLPDSELHLSALTPDDLAALPFIVAHADVVSLSFVRHPGDVAQLHTLLEELGGERLGVVLKIETVAGFENLPSILLEAMRWPRCGVMIARGDLAIEAGYGRLAEVQEEILWLCEAAHLPVIWATQVLDTLARTGLPSRAEVTDAAMAGRADCVMLNKGPFVDHAVVFLDGVLGRMADHQWKKDSLLPRIESWTR